MKGIQVLDRPASQGFYAVAGRLLFIESFDRELAVLIERLFAGWQLTPVSFPERRPDIKISFACSASLPEIPPGLSEFAVAAGGRCFPATDGFYLRFSQSLLRLREESPLSVAVSVTDPADTELGRVTSFAVCAGLRRVGLFELHSGGVVVPDSEAGVLIVGPSGSGKSTLTLQLAQSGWGYLSDDELLLSLAEEEVEARGFRSFFALTTASADVPANSLKTCFEPANVLAMPPVERAVPRFLLFTAVSGASETQVQELAQTETMSRLVRACPWATYDAAVAGPYLKLLSQLARQARGFELLAGKDLLEPGKASQIIRAACEA